MVLSTIPTGQLQVDKLVFVFFLQHREFEEILALRSTSEGVEYLVKWRRTGETQWVRKELVEPSKLLECLKKPPASREAVARKTATKASAKIPTGKFVGFDSLDVLPFHSPLLTDQDRNGASGSQRAAAASSKKAQEDVQVAAETVNVKAKRKTRKDVQTAVSTDPSNGKFFLKI